MGGDGKDRRNFLYLSSDKKEFYVRSRNLRLFDQESIYYENALQYHIKEHLLEYLKKNKKVNWVCIQGERVEKNPLRIKGHDSAVFNFMDSERGSFPSVEG